jgi:O-antigen/teichoic acid export membrane protein
MYTDKHRCISFKNISSLSVFIRVYPCLSVANHHNMIAKAKNQLRRLLPTNAFARGVSVLVGGTAGAQILLVLAAPILTRLYTPEDFGLLAVYASLLALIGVISSLRYELAIPLPEDDVEAANVAVLSLLLVVISTLLTSILVIMLGTPIANLLGVPVLANYLWLLPLGILLTGAYTVFNYWSVRTKRFTTIAKTKLSQALATLAIQLAAFKLGGIALLLGQVAGQGVGTTSLARPALAVPAFRQVSWGGIKYAAVRYRRFPIFSSWEGLSNTAGMQLPPMMFAALFSPAAAGLYALANRVLSLPMSLVGSAIGQVFFANAAEAHRAGKLGPLVQQLHAKLAHIGFPPALLLMLLGPDLFAFVFGENWRQAGEFARWMAPWLYLVFVSSPLSTVFSVTEQLKQALAFQLILLVSRVGAIVLGAWLGDLMLTIILFAGVSSLCYLGLLFWIAHLAGNAPRTMIQPTLRAAGIAFFCAVPVLASLAMADALANVWLYALLLSLLLIAGRYWQLLGTAY